MSGGGLVGRLVLPSILLGVAGAARADEDAARRVFVEATTDAADCFVGQSVPVRLRVGYDAEWFRRHAVPKFRRPLDLPVSVRAPWIRAVPDALVRAEEAPLAARLVSYALEDEEEKAVRTTDAVRDGRTFFVLDLIRRVVPRKAGDIVLAAPTLRFSYATEFREDFVKGDVPTDVKETETSGAPLVLRVRDLPTAGRPADFSGGVGRFKLGADAKPLDPPVGGTLKVVLRIDCDGESGAFDVPRLDDLPGLHLYGARESVEPRKREVVYEFEPLTQELKEFPAVAFSCFDVGFREYRTLRTKPIRLDVGPGTPRYAPALEPRRLVEPDSGGLVWAIVGVLVVVSLGVGVVVVRRSKTRRALDPDEVRARGAAAAFRAELARGGDVGNAFAEYLAARLRLPTAAVISPELPSRLAAAGVPGAVAARAASLMERLVAARYGAAAGDERAAAAATVDELEAVFSSD